MSTGLCRLEKCLDEAVEIHTRIECFCFRGAWSYEESTPAFPYHPATFRQASIYRSDRIGVHMKAACENSRARQAFTGRKIPTHDPEHDLSAQLFLNRFRAVFRNPEFHAFPKFVVRAGKVSQPRHHFPRCTSTLGALNRRRNVM